MGEGSGVMSTAADTIASLLSTGPRTTRELAVACGCDPDSPVARKLVSTNISRLRRDSLPVLNTRPRGSHGGAVYMLARRRCHHPGCITILSASNPSEYCRTHVPLHVVDLMIDLLIRDVGEELWPEMEGQLSLLDEAPPPATRAGERIAS